MAPPQGSDAEAEDSDYLGFPPGMTSARGRKVKPRLWDVEDEARGEETQPRQQRATPLPRSCHAPRESSPAELSSSDGTISEEDGDEAYADLSQKMRGSRRRQLPSLAASVGKRSSIPVRDDNGRFIGVRPKTAAERAQVGPERGGGIFKNAAARVLNEERRLMTTGEVAQLALARRYINVQGKTPEATMASAMYTDVKRKSRNGTSTFIRPHEGLFGLREWVQRGIAYQDPTREERSPSAEATPPAKRARHSSVSGPAGLSSSSGPRFQAPSPSPAHRSQHPSQHAQRPVPSSNGLQLSGPSGAGRGNDSSSVRRHHPPQQHHKQQQQQQEQQDHAGSVAPPPSLHVAASASAFQPAASGVDLSWLNQQRSIPTQAPPVVEFPLLGSPHLAVGTPHTVQQPQLPGSATDYLGMVMPSANAELSQAHLTHSLQQQQLQLAMQQRAYAAAPQFTTLAAAHSGSGLLHGLDGSSLQQSSQQQLLAASQAALQASARSQAAHAHALHRAASQPTQQQHLQQQQQQPQHRQAQGKGEDGGENIMLLINAAEELHRSDDHDGEQAAPERSTAATPAVEDQACREDAQSQHKAQESAVEVMSENDPRAQQQPASPPAEAQETVELLVQGHNSSSLKADAASAPPTPAAAGNVNAPEVHPQDHSPSPSPASAHGMTAAPPSAPASAASLAGQHAAMLVQPVPPQLVPQPSAHMQAQAYPQAAAQVPVAAQFAARAPTASSPAPVPAANGGTVGGPHAALFGRLLGPNPIAMEDLMQLEMTVRSLEELHGQVHPQVGKAYLLLAKVYQKGNTVEMQRLAEQALQRSREILSACSTMQGGLSEQTNNSFKYLMGKVGTPGAVTPADG